MLALSWNCRGLRNAPTVNSLRSFLRATRAQIGFLTETKCDRAYSELTLQRLGYQHYIVVPADGLFGGIWLFWDLDIDLHIISFSKNLVHAKVPATDTAQEWDLLCIYGPPDQSQRNQFWVDMCSITTQLTVPFVCLGDLNSNSCQSEKRGGQPFNPSSVVGFTNWIVDSGLLDLGFVGPAFTWENGQELGVNVAARLDRALASSGWCVQFPNAGVLHLPRYNSDHNPILLKTCMRNHSRTYPTRFEAVWLQSPTFKDTLKEVWLAHCLNGSLLERLKFVLLDLKQWGASVFGSLSKKIKQAEQKLLRLQVANPIVLSMEQEKNLKLELTELQRLNEFFWLQRSRINWINAGDRNSKFFHITAQHRKKKNTISSLKLSEGVFTTDYNIISTQLVNHFQSACQASSCEPLSDSILQALPKISETENASLFSIPSAEEILQVMHEIGAGKAPGPDGLPALFFHNCWDVVGSEVINLVQLFFHSASLPKDLNHTHLVLIPKKKNANLPVDFRPISLCNVLYKLITKILTMRIRPLLNRLISPFQNAFVPGRQIQDNLVISQELFHSVSKASNFNSYFALKLDMAKAYDRANWSFLSQVLQGFGFIGRTHDLIMACVTSPTFSVLVNGSPQGNFEASRGLRQGCPMSPYLFILCSEILSQLILEAERQNSFTGMQINSRAPIISHLLFADDLLFFGRATIENIIGVKHILLKYEAFSGQQVNFEKSCLHTSGQLDPTMKQVLLNILNVNVMGKADKYLGKHLLLPSSRLSSFSSLLERCKKKLASWKSGMLSHAGRLVLLKSSLASVPIYSMGTNLLPKGITNQIEQLQRRFWWGGSLEKKKLCLISWDKLTKPKKNGGLGIRDPSLVNLSLIAKLSWRFLTQGESIWCKLLKAKYLNNASFWDSGTPRVCSHVWRSMLTSRQSLMFNCCWKIGIHSQLHIWSEPWVLTLPGYRVVGRLNVQSRVSKVSDLFILHTSDWDLNLLHEIFLPHEAAAIASLSISAEDVVDKLIWIPSANGTFTAKSMYAQLIHSQASTSFSMNQTNGFWSKIWTIKGVAPRIILFIWRALNNGLAVGSRLFTIPGALRGCKRCNCPAEDINHVLLHFNIAACVWEKLNLPFQLASHGGSLLDFCTQLLHYDVDSFKRGCCTLWALWKARNALVFNDKRLTDLEVLHIANKLYADYNNCPPLAHAFGMSETDLSIQQQHISEDVTSLRWQFPPTNWLKVNVDGAVRSGSSAAGVVARDHMGVFVGCVSKQFGHLSPAEIEAHAFLLGIELTEELDLHNVILEGDAQVVVNAINDNSAHHIWRIRHTILRCRDFLNSRSDIICQFSPRSSNGVAHCCFSFHLWGDITMVQEATSSFLIGSSFF